MVFPILLLAVSSTVLHLPALAPIKPPPASAIFALFETIPSKLNSVCVLIELYHYNFAAFDFFYDSLLIFEQIAIDDPFIVAARSLEFRWDPLPFLLIHFPEFGVPMKLKDPLQFPLQSGNGLQAAELHPPVASPPPDLHPRQIQLHMSINHQPFDLLSPVDRLPIMPHCAWN